MKLNSLSLLAYLSRKFAFFLSLYNPMAAVAPAVAVNGVKIRTASQAYLEGKAVKDTRALVSQLCWQFYNLGWVSGTGGSINIKVRDDAIPKSQQLIIMSPSGIKSIPRCSASKYALFCTGLCNC